MMNAKIETRHKVVTSYVAVRTTERGFIEIEVEGEDDFSSGTVTLNLEDACRLRDALCAAITDVGGY